MDIATKINLSVTIMSLVLAIISIVFVLITIHQNNKMIETATRPYVCVYGASINTGSPVYYLVLKNYGSSHAAMTKFESSFDFTDCYPFSGKRNYIDDFANTVLAPGQSRICALDYNKIPSEVVFTLEYSCGRRKYSDTIKTNIKSGLDVPVSKNATDGKELRTISYTLQEMLQKRI